MKKTNVPVEVPYEWGSFHFSIDWEGWGQWFIDEIGGNNISNRDFAHWQLQAMELIHKSVLDGLDQFRRELMVLVQDESLTSKIERNKKIEEVAERARREAKHRMRKIGAIPSRQLGEPRRDVTAHEYMEKYFSLAQRAQRAIRLLLQDKQRLNKRPAMKEVADLMGLASTETLGGNATGERYLSKLIKKSGAVPEGGKPVDVFNGWVEEVESELFISN